MLVTAQKLLPIRPKYLSFPNASVGSFVRLDEGKHSVGGAFNSGAFNSARIISIHRGSTRRPSPALPSVYQRRKRANKRAAPAVLATALLTSLALIESPCAVVELSAPESIGVVVV